MLAERYGRSMINDFNNGTVARTDWNILLDETGGPNQLGNLCFAPVQRDTGTDELTLTNSYYYIGHSLNLFDLVLRESVVFPAQILYCRLNS